MFATAGFSKRGFEASLLFFEREKNEGMLALRVCETELLVSAQEMWTL
jgi:hypothetical protein